MSPISRFPVLRFWRWGLAALAGLLLILVAGRWSQDQELNLREASLRQASDAYVLALRGIVEKYGDLPYVVARHPDVLTLLRDPADRSQVTRVDRYLADLQCDGVPTSAGRPPADVSTLVFFGAGRSHAFGAEGSDPDFELWDVGRAALRSAAERLSIRIEELLYARADVAGTGADACLVSLDLIAPQLGFGELDADDRDRAQRRFAVEVTAALERLGLGPLAQRRP